MSQSMIIEKLDQKHLKKDIPNFEVGDTVKVHTRIIEGTKERVQVFAGTVIAKTGSGLSETFSMHRVAYGKGMERVFALHSPKIAKIEIVRKGRVRRAKLYYLRGTQGKAAKVQSRFGYKVEEQQEHQAEVLGNQNDEQTNA
jgi:ribosomal protein L19, bacterial type